MMKALGDWEVFLHERGKMPDLIQCGLMHEQFEAIHPFLDGNGRMGRLLITLFLLERDRLSQPLLYLSAYIEANRQEYYDLLQRVRTHGDWHGWLHYFLVGIAETANDAVSRASELMDLRERFRTRLTEKPKALALLDELFVNPYMTVAKASKILKVSNPTARQAVLQLEETGMLEEISGRKWGRLYLARPIMKVIERPSETNIQT
jgi:Fic family protein